MTPEDTKVLFLSHTADGGSFKVGSHHLARELSAMGFDVAHVSTPVSMLHLITGRGDQQKRTQARLPGSRDEHGTFQSVPLVGVPIQFHGAARALRRYLVTIGYWDADFVLVDQPLMGAVLKRSMPGVIVYRPTDEVTAPTALRRQRRVIQRSAGVVATSRIVLDSLELDARHPTRVIENGVDFERFSEPTVANQREGILYVGALDDRFDWSLVGAIAESFDTTPLRLYGPLMAEPPTLPLNVELMGALKYSELASRLQSGVVGLLPLSDSPKNAGRSPMKYYEYLAASMYVVARSSPELARRTAPGAFLYSDPDEAVKAVGRALSMSVPNLGGREEASKHDWRGKTLELLSFLDSLKAERLSDD